MESKENNYGNFVVMLMLEILLEFPFIASCHVSYAFCIVD